jgi:2-keto-4-pentenoate hydratase/2-oxohepta-3-ene-1,7-dioic acid hydratase in catechol pathway
MKLVQFRLKREEKATPRMGALIAGGKAILDLAGTLDGQGKGGWLPPHNSTEWWNMESSLWSLARSAADVASGADDKTVAHWMKTGRVIALEDARLCAPVPRPGKLICIGLNYRDHALETGKPFPETPMIFSKFATAIIGPEETVVVPRSCTQPDFEAELAVVIGRVARNVPRAKAFEYVLGYTIINDVTARDFQANDKQWQRGKSCDTFAPMGPYVATRDEIPNPDLAIKLRVNGETMQDSRTNQLIFDIPQLIEFITASSTLEPGDMISTGTPSGVGCARKPPVFLKQGDRMEVEIEGLGVLTNPVALAKS